MASPARKLGLGSVLLCLAATLALGFLLKTQPSIQGGHVTSDCAAGAWSGQQYRHYCYSDIVPLFDSEQLGGGRLPYLDRCTTSRGECDEYPVLTMYAMRVAAWASGGRAGFFVANALMLSIAAFATAICLYLLVGPRALVFALAPTLLIYGFMNWDLLAVALATAATLAYVNRRDIASGVLIGLGAATKLYPALLVVPFVLGRFRDKEPDRGIHLAWSAAGTWLAVNLPFALSSPGSWWEFFRFNAARQADWDSLWYIGCTRLVTHQLSCPGTGLVNTASLLLFAGGSALVWRLKKVRDPEFPRFSFGFPLLLVFLLTSKVYSPQYGLWLLPWFAVGGPDLRLFVAFELADVVVFVTRFSWFGRLSGYGGLPIGAFEIAVLARAAVLLVCLASWVRARRGVPTGPPLEDAAEAAVAA